MNSQISMEDGMRFGAIFILFFITLWVCIVGCISIAGGWHSWAKVYKVKKKPEGFSFSWCSLHIPPCTGYSSCIECTLSKDGVYLIPSILFRFMHPGILIPWSCLVTVSSCKFLFFSWHTAIIKIGDKTVKLSIPKKAAAIIKEIKENPNKASSATL